MPKPPLTDYELVQKVRRMLSKFVPWRDCLKDGPAFVVHGDGREIALFFADGTFTAHGEFNPVSSFFGESAAALPYKDEAQLVWALAARRRITRGEATRYNAIRTARDAAERKQAQIDRLRSDAACLGYELVVRKPPSAKKEKKKP